MVCALVCLGGRASAATLYVWQGSPTPTPPYTNWATAAHKLQRAVDAAQPGDTVLVTNGVYATGGRTVSGTMTNRVAVDKPLIVRSVNGPAVTVIQGYQVPETTDGDGAIRCVYLADGAVLSGFTLTQGATRTWGHYSGEQSGGGVWCESTNALITNCALIANSARWAGGGAFQGTLKKCTLTVGSARYGGGVSGGILHNCTLTGNSASLSGGGARDSTLTHCTLTSNSAPYGGGAGRGTLNNCTLTGNSASSSGGGAYYATLHDTTVTSNSAACGGGACAGTLNRCVLTGNSASSSGGGAYSCTLNNCTLTGNSATGVDAVGGGAYRGTLNNCTLTGNSASVSGGGARYSSLNNCILYYNTTLSGSGANYVGATLNYCCTTPLPGTGIGNISLKPQLASASHLSADSPCRGAGSAQYVTGLDTDGEVWADPPSIGCDEYWPGAVTGPLHVSIQAAYTKVAVGFALALTGEVEGRASCSRWEFGDGTVLSNRPFAQHAWISAGDYTVRLTAFNEDHPVGVSATLVIRVVEAVHYVAVGSRTPKAPYLSWARAARTIQEAVDAVTVPGALVLVTNGVYATGGRPVYGVIPNRVVVDKTVRVESVNGPALTLIQGCQVPGLTNAEGAVRCVYLTNGAVLSGFTLTNGATGNSGDHGHHEREETGGGVWCESTNAVVTNCTITGNAAYLAGGAYSGTLDHCTLTGNWAEYSGGAHNGMLNHCTLTGNSATGIFGGSGGGAYSCNLSHCTLTGNSARAEGGGVSWSTLNHCALTGNSAVSGGGASRSTLNHCTLSGNSAHDGGGIFYGELTHCTLTGNSARWSGGGAFFATLYTCVLTGNSANLGGGACYGGLSHCTLTGNSASLYGGGIYTDTPYSGTLHNCIVYDNTACVAGANYSGGAFNYCCTTPLPAAGTGNIRADPQLASSSHLSAGSPCRGAGDLNVTGLDIDGEPWADPPSIGCDEYSPGAATGPMSVSLHAAYTNVAVGFAVSLMGQIEGRASANRWKFGDGMVVSNRLHTQHAWMSPGDYTVRLTAYNEDHPAGVNATVTVRVMARPVHYVVAGSAAPAEPFTSWATAAPTIQKAVNAASVPGALVLVSNGVYATGGKAVYGTMTNRVAVDKPVRVKSVNGPAVTVIVGRQVPGTINGNGAVRCVYLTNGAVLSGFTLTQGATAISGDTERKRKGGGAWCASADALVTNCILTGNSAYAAGGGAYSGTLKNCRLMGNSASSGGGAAGGTLDNCTLTGNSASSGGGIYDGTVNNCTLTGNSAEYGGGARGATLQNCILYYNTANRYPNYPFESGIALNSCCTTPLPTTGVGNITNAPLFVDLAGGNLRLQSNSPCINAGNNAYVSGTSDLDGRPRIVGGTVDIGAYEFQGTGFGQLPRWLVQSGLPTHGSADYTYPINAQSALRITSIVAGPPVTVQFISSSNRLYTLRYTTNLTDASWVDIPGQIDVPGNGGWQTLRDTNAVPPRFYRVSVRVP